MPNEISPDSLLCIEQIEQIAQHLRTICARPEAAPFVLHSAEYTIQFLLRRDLRERPLDTRQGFARAFARVLGGRWTVKGDQWESPDTTLLGSKWVVLHYVEPAAKEETDSFVDLDEPVTAETLT